MPAILLAGRVGQGRHAHRADRGHREGQFLDVAGQTRHQPSDGVAVEEAQAEPLKLREDLGAQVVHHPLADPGREQDLRVAEHQSEHEGERVDSGEDSEQLQIAVGNRPIDRDGGQVGPDQLEARGDDQHDHRQRHAHPVGLEVAEQATHQVRVVGSAESLFLVEIEFGSWMHRHATYRIGMLEFNIQ